MMALSLSLAQNNAAAAMKAWCDFHSFVKWILKDETRMESQGLK